MPDKQIDFQGHRGARGLMPENTISAMLKAIDLGVTTLEMDVVISKDGKVVLSHEPYFHEHITTPPQGGMLNHEQALGLLLYQMDYNSIRRYDVGMKPHPNFPKQQKIPAYKPLLSDLIDSCEAYASSKGKQMRYNIEIKSSAGKDGIQHPAPAEFSELVFAVLSVKKILPRTTIQSFDVRPLQYLHQNHPQVVLSYLVEATTTPLESQLQVLGFTPPVYSPYYRNLTPLLVEEAHAKGMKIIPWTINTLEEINRLLQMGVDGIISDYPDLFAQVHRNAGNKN